MQEERADDTSDGNPPSWDTGMHAQPAGDPPPAEGDPPPGADDTLTSPPTGTQEGDPPPAAPSGGGLEGDPPPGGYERETFPPHYGDDQPPN